MTAKKHSLCTVWTTCYSLGELKQIEVQVLIRKGLPRFDIIGLPQNMIREGKDRILSALSHLGVELPTEKILINLNPGDIPKEGSHFDLPILVGIIGALKLINLPEPRSFFWGELGLDGSVRPLDEILAHLFFAQKFKPLSLTAGGADSKYQFILPYILPTPLFLNECSKLIQFDHESKPKRITPKSNLNYEVSKLWVSHIPSHSQWNNLRGTQEQFLFWSLIALGRHHVLIEGSPGMGKTSWCQAIRELQPPLFPEHWANKFCYTAGLSKKIKTIYDLMRAPYESPHHSSSQAAIVGGGNASISAGAITRANRGILFLDEFSELSRDVLQSLREPLEAKTISIARRGVSLQLAADIQLLAAMNPCKCGNHRSKKCCLCRASQLNDYRQRISTPLRDRFHSNCFWVYNDQKRPEAFSLLKVKRRIIECLSLPYPILSDIDFPERFSPRKQARWIEFFTSWCRWFGLERPSQKDATQFSQFIKKMETQDDEIHNTKT